MSVLLEDQKWYRVRLIFSGDSLPVDDIQGKSNKYIINMPASIAIYCHQSVADATSEDILKGLASEDWHMLGELYGVDDDEIVDLALSYFHINGESGHFTLHFRPPEKRQLEISIAILNDT